MVKSHTILIKRDGTIKPLKMGGGKLAYAVGLTDGTAFDIPISEAKTGEDAILVAKRRFLEMKEKHLPVGKVRF